MLCCVLIYGIISCSADDSEDRKAGHECIGQYLKRKGLIEYEVSADKKFSMCLTVVDAQLGRLHTRIENKMKEALPNESTCVVEAFNESNVYDIVMKAAFYESDGALSRDEKFVIYTNLEKEGEAELEKVGTKCGVDAKDLDKYMDQVFDSKETTNSSSSESKE